MKLDQRFRRTVIRGLVVSLATGATLVTASSPSAAAPVISPKWSRTIAGTQVVTSSPTPDGKGNVWFGGTDGRLFAVRGTDGGDAIAPIATGQPIFSSPSLADVDGDGSAEVFVGNGSRTADGGSERSYTASGALRFAFTGTDPNHAAQSIFSSAAIGDVNSDGVPDATFGALGLTTHSLNAADGRENPGWPFYSGDTQFSTPALVDVNGDGSTDVVLGSDAAPGGLSARGGSVRAISGGGQLLWEFGTDDTVNSSPAVGDIDGDGRPEIVFGGGDFYYECFLGRRGACDKPATAPRDTFRVHALDLNGREKPGWPKDTGEKTIASVALADVNGDGRLDVIEGTAANDNSGHVFAWDGSGTQLWRVTPPGGAVIGGVATGDLNGDGAQDVVVGDGAGLTAWDGRSGTQLYQLGPIPQMSYHNVPLVADIDSNGRLDVVAVGFTQSNTTIVQAFELPAPATTGALGWHMFHKDPRHTGSWTNPPLIRTFCPEAVPGGYWTVAADGGIFAFCNARFHGSTGALRLNQPVVGMASTSTGSGYWLVARDGGIFSFGDARFLGSTGAIRLNQPIVGMERTPSGNGYWLVAGDGGIFAFGDARFLGSTGAIRLNQPIVGMARTVSGNGYWLVARDGGVFAFGDARFQGSTGAIKLNQPIVGMARTSSGNGYWLVAADGGIFSFGDARFFGSTGAIKLNLPVVGMAATPTGNGYWLVASDGGIFSYGDARFFGSTGAIKLNLPIVGMAVPGI